MSAISDALAQLETDLGNVQGGLNTDDKQRASDAATAAGSALANLRSALGDQAHEPSQSEAAPSYTPSEIDNPPNPQPEGSQAPAVEGATQEPISDEAPKDPVL
jgi:hypothetical protein